MHLCVLLQLKVESCWPEQGEVKLQCKIICKFLLPEQVSTCWEGGAWVGSDNAPQEIKVNVNRFWLFIHLRPRKLKEIEGYVQRA